MKSGKQRRAEIKARRAERAVGLQSFDPRGHPKSWPLGVVASNPAKLALNNGSIVVACCDHVGAARPPCQVQADLEQPLRFLQSRIQ